MFVLSTALSAPASATSPVQCGEWFRVTNYLGDTTDRTVGHVYQCYRVGLYYVFGYDVDGKLAQQCYSFSEVEKVDAAEAVRAQRERDAAA